MKDTEQTSFTIDESKFLIHFQDNNSSVVILDYDESSQQYYRLTDFGSDVVSYILGHPGTSFNEIAENLTQTYDASLDKVESNLNEVIQKLSEQSIL